jgi:hypothetical protein
MFGSAFGISVPPNVFSIGRCFPAPAVPPLRGGMSQWIGEIASRPESPPPTGRFQKWRVFDNHTFSTELLLTLGRFNATMFFVW